MGHFHFLSPWTFSVLCVRIDCLFLQRAHNDAVIRRNSKGAFSRWHAMYVLSDKSRTRLHVWLDPNPVGTCTEDPRGCSSTKFCLCRLCGRIMLFPTSSALANFFNFILTTNRYRFYIWEKIVSKTKRQTQGCLCLGPGRAVGSDPLTARELTGSRRTGRRSCTQGLLARQLPFVTHP